MKLTKYGIREWLGSGIIAIILLAATITAAITFNYPVLGWTLSSVIIVIWLAIAAFFRLPVRKIPQAPELIVSPADGVVRDIELIKDDEIEFFKGQSMVRVGIFLSVLDVHVNRAPADMKVEYKKYRKGKYLDARHSNASKENEAMTIAGTANVCGKEFPIGVKQISGAIARRIVCQVEPGDSLEKGYVYGMIKFGSRTELYLPATKDITLNVKVGDRVYSGSTVMATLAKTS
ncbi:MAG: phosphatidylserine decarboxylase family protein [Victivallales bacterium]|nr:phosphatidylserine decarboxylase family protein [Victivallales bacterium]